MPGKRLPENKEARYQVRLQRGNSENPATGHADRATYCLAAADEVWNWAYNLVPAGEQRRMLRKYIEEVVRLQDESELRGNGNEFRDALGQVRKQWDHYLATHNLNPPSAVIKDWMHQYVEPIQHLPVAVPDKNHTLHWSKEIGRVSRHEVTRMGELRDRNLSRASIGRANVQLLEDGLSAVRASDADSLQHAFNF